jgi:hypothetical protein
MSPAHPKTISLEFNDGTNASVPFDSLPDTLQDEILCQPFASRPISNPKDVKFALLEWDDGWKEVIEVDPTCRDINRYYVISRSEDRGRLSLNKVDGYPELIEINRKPKNIERITFVDTFRLRLNRSTREGKKIDHFYTLSKETDTVSKMLKAFKTTLQEDGIDREQLLSTDPALQKEQLENIRKKMGIMAGRRQQDVFDFIRYLTALIE